MKYLEYVVDDLIKGGWDKMKGYTIVFPMRRAELFVKKALSERLKDSDYLLPVILPRMTTLDDLVSDWCPLHVADEIHSVCRLYNIYTQKMGRDLTLDAFYGWGRQLVNDFSSVDMALQDADKVINLTAAAQTLEQVELDAETREHLQELVNLKQNEDIIQNFFKKLWEHLPSIYKQFVQQQEEQNQGTKGACYRWVVNHFDELEQEIGDRTYVFVGFNYLLPAERKLMELLKNRGKARFYWDNDPSFSLDDHVYQYIRHNINILGEEANSVDGEKQVKKLSVAATVSANAQAQYVGRWLAENHHSGERTAVVIADEAMLEPVLYSLPDTLFGKVNITKGYPLKHTQIYADVVAYLTDKSNDKTATETNYAGVLLRLTDFLNSQMPSVSKNAAWQKLLLAEAYCQTQLVINRFSSLMEEGILDDVKELKTLRNLIGRCMDTVSLPFHGEPVEEIQIIGVLETRLLDFDNVLILNVEEGVVPGNSSDSSFIPFDIRKAYGMQTHEDEARIYAYNFFRLIRRSEKVDLLFSEAAGDMSKKTMSRFIMQMLLSPDFEVTKKRITENTDTAEINEEDIQKTLADNAKAGVLYLSPSALGTYVECKREFYLKYLLKLNEPEGNSLILAPHELGSLFHGAIESAYMHICGHEVEQETPVDKAAIKAYIDAKVWNEHIAEDLARSYQLLNRSYRKKHPDGGEGDKYILSDHPAENAVVGTLVRNVLEHDAELDNLRLCGLEKELRREIKVEDLTVSLGGVIDRLDKITENGKEYLRVLDYKTGGYDSDKMGIKSINDITTDHTKQYVLQTLIYCGVCDAHKAEINPQDLPIMPQLLYVQKLSADRHITINKQPVLDYNSIKGSTDSQPTVDQQIEVLIKDMLHEREWPKCEENKCGKFCPFHLLCGREKKEF